MKTNPIGYSIRYGAGALHLQCLHFRSKNWAQFVEQVVWSRCVLQMKPFSSHLKGLAIHIPSIMSVGHKVKRLFILKWNWSLLIKSPSRARWWLVHRGYKDAFSVTNTEKKKKKIFPFQTFIIQWDALLMLEAVSKNGHTNIWTELPLSTSCCQWWPWLDAQNRVYRWGLHIFMLSPAYPPLKHSYLLALYTFEVSWVGVFTFHNP